MLKPRGRIDSKEAQIFSLRAEEVVRVGHEDFWVWWQNQSPTQDEEVEDAEDASDDDGEATAEEMELEEDEEMEEAVHLGDI